MQQLKKDFFQPNAMKSLNDYHHQQARKTAGRITPASDTI
jgi:hypothetical protein